MRGLLIKEFYMLGKYCKCFLIVLAVFLVVALLGGDNYFYLVFPCILTGSIPLILFSYDEREKWCVYSGALPYSKAQLVSVKYIMNVLICAVTLILTLAAEVLSDIIHHDEFVANQWMSALIYVTILSLIFPSILMPFAFRFGSEKGRMVYYLVVGMFSGLASLIVSLDQFSALTNIQFPHEVFALLCVLALFVLSWFLSILLYQKREV